MTTPPTGTRSLSERVAEEIRVVMLRRRITGAQLAARLNVSPAWVSYRLSGKQAIDLNDLDSIARILDVSVQALLPNGPGPNSPNNSGVPREAIHRTTLPRHAIDVRSHGGSVATSIRRPQRRNAHTTGTRPLASTGMVLG
jgi:transcriptional regulator with XRE-family HTH domain